MYLFCQTLHLIYFNLNPEKNLHFTKCHGRNILLWKYNITLSTEYLKTLRDSTSSSSRFSCDELDQNIISLCNMGISPATYFFKNIQVANLILPYNDIFVIESAAFKLLIKFVYYLSPTPVDIDQDQITIWLLIHSSYISTNLYFRGKIKKCISIMINFISTLKRINHYIIYRIKHFLQCFMVKKRKHGG